MSSEKYGSLWSRDELVLALYLYCQIPFAKTKANNPEVIRLLHLLERTPASVARKLGNFGAFDPRLASQGISGLTHGGKGDKAVWDEFYQRWESLVSEAKRLLARAPEAPASVKEPNKRALDEPIIAKPSGPTEKEASVVVRLGQAFFRRAILSSYECSCCVCGLEFASLLTASHIRPWATNADLRVDPENGLCLCALHDRAFDRGLLTVRPSLEIAVAAEVKRSTQEFARISLAAFDGRKIQLPRRFAPRTESLVWHNENLFAG
jgi:hypothetical protein